MLLQRVERRSRALKKAQDWIEKARGWWRISWMSSEASGDEDQERYTVRHIAWESKSLRKLKYSQDQPTARFNNVLKKDLTQSFSNFYVERVSAARDARTSIDNVKMNLQLSAIKPLHTNWLLGAVDRLETKPDVIARGWERTGIRDAIKKVL
uniref:Uncharacterized protein n=1 Tax=Branchiostoma floridae TaxID=7739 RepID=C3YY46_BRAFL|eukprot:XP_002598993.1 hypothetical protein BRAFLDRAFT_79926 [Branchiostoma floridae]